GVRSNDSHFPLSKPRGVAGGEDIPGGRSGGERGRARFIMGLNSPLQTCPSRVRFVFSLPFPRASPRSQHDFPFHTRPDPSLPVRVAERLVARQGAPHCLEFRCCFSLWNVLARLS